MSKTPISIFSSYSSADEALRRELENHLAVLTRSGLIRTWNFRQIEAGDDWRRTIDAKLNEASIILLLVSADFLASDYCWQVEMTRALERHDSGDAVVIPVILRDCDWHAAPLAKLQALPEAGKPVARWKPRDRGWSNVVAGIRKVVDAMPGRVSSDPRSTKTNSEAVFRSGGRLESQDQVPAEPLRTREVLRERVLLVSFDGHGTSFIPLRRVTAGTSVVVELEPASPHQSAVLEKLQRNLRSKFGLAYGLSALLGALEDASKSYENSSEVWRLVFLPERSHDGSAFMEMSTSGFSADDIAHLRARRILLNEMLSASRTDSAGILNGGTLEVLVRGMNTPLEVTESPLPALFVDCGRDSEFLAAARLLLVLYLRLSQVVEHILKLELSFDGADRLKVDFEGERARKFQNVLPSRISVHGLCKLRSA